jgi:type II secretory pathway pseudopilin PulG
MFCRYCGGAVAVGAYFCRACGKDLTAAATPPVPDPGPAVTGPAITDGKAIASLICGLLFFFFPAAIVAIILGHISLSQIRKSAGRLRGEGLAIGGLVLGYLGIVFIPVILIIAAIAIPNLLRARMAANESSALNAVRTVNLAEMTYMNSHAERGFTCSLSELHQAGLVDDGLASGKKHGYTFALQNCTADKPGGPNVKYQVVAQPVTFNQTGVRAFCADESGVIKVDSRGSGQGCVENGAELQ